MMESKHDSKRMQNWPVVKGSKENITESSKRHDRGVTRGHTPACSQIERRPYRASHSPSQRWISAKLASLMWWPIGYSW